MLRSTSYTGIVIAILLTSACSNEPTVTPSAEETGAETPASEPNPEQTAVATEPIAGPELNVDEQGRALRGFDAVAYHLEGKAVTGAPEFSHTWRGVPWLFAKQANRDAFATEPERYAPANGGYCTFGVVLKKKLDIDPEIFLVEDELLYLFLNHEVQEKFLGDKEGNLSMVTSHWPEIADKHPEELVSEGP